MKAYWELQHPHNPNSGGGAFEYHYRFECGDASFFVMDTRYHRNASIGRMLDENQENDLLNWISQNPKKLKFIVSSVPFVGHVIRDDQDKWCSTNFNQQRARILKKILDVGASNVIFLTGDMHTSYHATMDISDNQNTVRIHELMSSPINQITPKTKLTQAFDPDSKYKLEGLNIHSSIHPKSFYGDHSNVMIVSVTFAETNPKVSFEIYRTTKNENGPKGLI